jgi:hypothetical protein
MGMIDIALEVTIDEGCVIGATEVKELKVLVPA